MESKQAGRMKITITKKESRNLLRCIRDDGTSMIAELGPGLPHHDLAHFVIERKLGLTGGFFGKISEGYTVAQLSDKDIIKTLGAQTLIAEVVARALQSLSSGACTFDQFMELINTELAQWRIAALTIEPGAVTEMSDEFQLLLDSYLALRNGQSLELHFPAQSSTHKSAQVLPQAKRGAYLQ
jgi:hypothetical protein